MECLVRNTTRDSVLADRVAIAASPLRRLRGLLGTRTLPMGYGLLLRPCRQVHSFFMRYPLDLVFIDREGRVVRTIEDFAPSRCSPFVAGAAAVLELPAGALAETPALPGDLLSVLPRTNPPEVR